MVDLFYFAEPFKVYNNLSVAMITLSFAIVTLIIPYLNISLSKVLFANLKLEKDKSKLSLEEITNKYLDNKNAIINNKKIVSMLFSIIFIFGFILFFSTYILLNGDYNCLDILTCKEDNNPLWAINQNKEILGIKISFLYSTFPVLVLIGFGILTYTIKDIYDILKDVINEEAKDRARILEEETKKLTK